jgi:hypothetical protein
VAQLADSKTRARFEGHDVEAFHCQFAGSWDLEDDEAGAIGLDRVVVFLVAGRITKASFELQESSGELHRKSVVKVSEARMLRGSVRDEALSYLVQGPDQSQLHFGVTQFTGIDDDPDFQLPDDATVSNGRSEAAQSASTPSDPSGAALGAESLGSVYPAGKVTDEHLAKFLQSP